MLASALTARDVLELNLAPRTVASVFILMSILAVIGVCVLIIHGVIGLLSSALRGEPREMTLPLMGVSSLKRQGRALMLRAPFDSARSSSWTLYARNSADAKAIESALTAGAKERVC